jgi:hypothetical protein
VKRALLAAALLAVAGAARAAESPRWGSFELSGGTYKPDVDAEFNGAETPFQDAFGTGYGWMLRAGGSWTVFRRAGSLEVGLASGYFWKTGHGQDEVTGSPSGDETSLRIIPVSAMVTYRADFLAERYGIPFAPYGRAALERFHWWVNDGNGDRQESGATNGWSVTGGLALLLDIIDPSLAREADRDTGINHTYLFFEVTKRTVDDFGSSSSWILSDDGVGYAGGLLFVF